MDVQTSEKMGDKNNVDEDVQIVEAHIDKGKRQKSWHLLSLFRLCAIAPKVLLL